MVGGQGMEGGQEVVYKIKEEHVGLNQAKLWAIQISKLAKMKGSLEHRPLFNFTKLNNHVQPSPGSIQAPDHLYSSPLGFGKSSQQKQTTQPWLILTVKFDGIFM